MTAEDYAPEDGDTGKDAVVEWIGELRGDAEFNLQAYVDCFLSENLARKYISYRGQNLTTSIENLAKQWRGIEEAGKGAANISFDLRKSEEDIDYLSMDKLAQTVEGEKMNNIPSLWRDAFAYKPVRNALGHGSIELSGE